MPIRSNAHAFPVDPNPINYPKTPITQVQDAKTEHHVVSSPTATSSSVLVSPRLHTPLLIDRLESDQIRRRAPPAPRRALGPMASSISLDPGINADGFGVNIRGKNLAVTGLSVTRQAQTMAMLTSKAFQMPVLTPS
jgi:hypothetical protein